MPTTALARLPALVAAVALTVACAPDPSPTVAPPSPPPRSATPPPTRPPLPLKKRDPCDLLSRHDKARIKAMSSEFKQKAENLYSGRSCQYDITRAADDSFFTVAFTIVEHQEPPEFVEPLAPIGRHRGALTAEDKNGYDASYSIVVTKRSRVDVTFAAGTYRDRGEYGAVEYARLIEPRLP